MGSESNYMDCKEVAQHFNLDERLVRDLAAAKLLPLYPIGKNGKMGKLWRFPRNRILAIANRLPKGALENYDRSNTIILWVHLEAHAPVSLCDTIAEKFRIILDDHKD